MFVQDRDTARRFFVDVWHKYREKVPMEPMEGLVSGVIMEHPEYHAYLENVEDAVTQEFSPETGRTNPFLHMGMHITIREQVGSDRPQGIRTLYQQLLPKFVSSHELEHRMMECLAEALWTAQRAHGLPDELSYMECLRKIS